MRIIKRHRIALGLLAVCACISAGACGGQRAGFSAPAEGSGSSSGSSPSGSSSSGGGSSGGNSGGDNTFVDSGASESGGENDAGSGTNDCPASAQMVYVTGDPAELWSFWPPTFTFTKIGNLSCTNSPTHMTVDRSGTAWIVGDGQIYKTSTSDATCTALSTWTGHSGFDDFALSFVGVTSADSTLYLLGDTDLASFDVASGQFQTIGAPKVAGTGGDMTSNGDGSLYFLEAYTTPHPLYEINPSNAAIDKQYTVKAQGVNTQALAYFGARFYAFENNVVYEYDPTANTLTSLGQAPLNVTGAGQSTCVPKEVTDAAAPVAQ